MKRPFLAGFLTIFVAAIPASAAKIVLVAGGGDGKDGSPAIQAKLITPFGVDFDSKGRIYFVEMEKGERLRTIEPDGTIRTVAGTGEKGSGGDSGPAMNAAFNGMHGLAIDHVDVVYLADTWNYRVRAYYPATKRIDTLAGTGKKTAGDASGPAAQANFGGIFSICMNPNRDRVFITDLDNRRIYEIDPRARAIWANLRAGNGKKAIPKDGGIAADEPLVDPRACAVDSDGNLYILERAGHSLRVVNKDGIIKTVMGTGKSGTAVGRALESQMNGPKHLCIDQDNSVIIADAENHRILRFDPKTNLVTVIAGNGKKGKDGLDGKPLKCELNRPHGVTVHPKTGELYIVDSYNDRILKILK